MLKALRTYLNKKFPLTPSRDIPAEYRNLKDINLIGFAYNIRSAEPGEVLKQIIDCISGQDIQYKGLIIESKRNAYKKILASIPEIGENPNLTIITKNYLSWMGIPDIHRTAKFFIGMRSSTISLYSMVLEREYKRTLDEVEYVKQVFHYVKAIKAGGENGQHQ